MRHVQVAIVWPVDQDRSNARGKRGADIPRGVADEVGSGEVDDELFRGRDQHSRFWLAAVAGIRVAMRADLDIVEWNLGAKNAVHFVERLAAHLAASDGGLIGGEHDQEPGVTEPAD